MRRNLVRRNRYLLGQTDQYIREIGHKIQEQREQGRAAEEAEEPSASASASASPAAADGRCVTPLVFSIPFGGGQHSSPFVGSLFVTSRGREETPSVLEPTRQAGLASRRARTV